MSVAASSSTGLTAKGQSEGTGSQSSCGLSNVGGSQQQHGGLAKR